jgi:5-formyltetrahydrofolate cyclo-ligase
MKKSVIRKAVLSERKKMLKDIVQIKSTDITNKIKKTGFFHYASYIMCYYPILNEVDTLMLMEYSLEIGKHIVLPKIQSLDEGEKEIVTYEISNISHDLIKGFYNIPEPDITKCKTIEPQQIDLVLVPGVAFSKRNERLGYGGGFYDKFLPKLRSDCIKIGLGYEFQIMDKLPFEEYDIKMDLIIY